MKCETRTSCRNEAELWIHLNGKPKRSCVACSTRAIGDLQVVESHWNAPLDQPCPSPAHRALTPAEREAIIKAEDRNGGKAIPLPPPTEETEACLPSSGSPPTVEPSEETDMGSKPPTLTLRPDADARPELCRVAECLSGDKPPKRLIRGLCEPDYKLAHRAGRLAEFALPSTQGQAKPKPETPLMPLTASEPDVVLSEGDALRPHGAAAVPVAVPAVERSPADTLDLSGLTVEEMGYALAYVRNEDGDWLNHSGMVLGNISEHQWASWPEARSYAGQIEHPTERAAMERLYRLALKEGRALRPIPVRTEPADPPPAPPAPAVVELQVIRQSDADSVDAARAHLRAALGLTPYATELPDGTSTAKAGIAALAGVAGAWLKGREARLQSLLGKTEAMLEKVDAAIAAPAPLPTVVDECITRLNAELAQWRDLADASGDALEAIAEAMDCEHDPEKPIGPQLVQRAQNLLNLNKEWEAVRDAALRERDEAIAARDRSQNELLALASEVKHLTQRVELAEDAATERRYELDTALQTYADLRAKLCQIFGEDPAELTDQGIVDKATMTQHWWERTENEFKAFRLAVAQLVDVEEEMADADYLLDNLRAALEQPPSYGPFRVDSAVYIPNGRGQATLTWAHGDKVLVPAGSMVNLIVVGVGRG